MEKGTLQTGQGWGRTEAGGGNGVSTCTGVVKPEACRVTARPLGWIMWYGQDAKSGR